MMLDKRHWGWRKVVAIAVRSAVCVLLPIAALNAPLSFGLSRGPHLSVETKMALALGGAAL